MPLSKQEEFFVPEFSDEQVSIGECLDYLLFLNIGGALQIINLNWP